MFTSGSPAEELRRPKARQMPLPTRCSISSGSTGTTDESTSGVPSVTATSSSIRTPMPAQHPRTLQLIARRSPQCARVLAQYAKGRVLY
jgi:hypothetical protein